MSLDLAMSQFAMVKAYLGRLVTSQDEMITEIFEKAPREFHLVQNMVLNLKIKVQDKNPPLKVFISYPNSPSVKNVTIYTSNDVKEPNAQSHVSYYSNPRCIELKGIIDSKSGKSAFPKQWFYLAIESNTERCAVRINCVFKEMKKIINKRQSANNSDCDIPEAEYKPGDVVG